MKCSSGAQVSENHNCCHGLNLDLRLDIKILKMVKGTLSCLEISLLTMTSTKVLLTAMFLLPFKCSNVQMFKCSNVQMFKCSCSPSTFTSEFTFFPYIWDLVSHDIVGKKYIKFYLVHMQSIGQGWFLYACCTGTLT